MCRIHNKLHIQRSESHELTFHNMPVLKEEGEILALNSNSEMLLVDYK